MGSVQRSGCLLETLVKRAYLSMIHLCRIRCDSEQQKHIICNEGHGDVRSVTVTLVVVYLYMYNPKDMECIDCRLICITYHLLRHTGRSDSVINVK